MRSGRSRTLNKLKFLDIPLLADLDRVHKVKLLAEFTQVSFPAGETIFEEGEFGDSLFIILQGSVRIFLQSAGDKTLAVLGERECFGEMSLLTDDPRSAAAQAVTDVVALKLTKERFDRILLENNALAVQFAGILARRLANLNRQASKSSVFDEAAAAIPFPRAEERQGEAGGPAEPYAVPEQETAPAGGKADEEAGRFVPAASAGVAAALWLLCAGVGIGLFFWLRELEYPYRFAVLASAGAAGIAAMILRLSPPLIVTILMAVVIAGLGAANPEQLLAPFSQEPLLAAVAFACSAYALSRWGPAQRLLLRYVAFSNRRGWAGKLGLLGAGFLLPLLLPSHRFRSEAAEALVSGQDKERLLLPFSFLFMHASLTVWFVIAVFFGTHRETFVFGRWFLAALPVTVVLLVAMTGFAGRRGAANGAAEVSGDGGDPLRSAQLDMLGIWSGKEKWSLAAVIVATGLLVATQFLPVTWLAPAVCLILLLAANGMFGNETVSFRSVGEFILFGLLAGLADAMIRDPLISTTTVPPAAALVLFAAVALARFLLPPLPAVWAGLVLAAPTALSSGLSPLVVGLLAVVAASSAGLAESAGRAVWRPGLRRTAVAVLAVLVSLPVWQRMELVGATVAREVPEAVLSGGHQVLVQVRLPENASQAASLQRGVQLGLAHIPEDHPLKGRISAVFGGGDSAGSGNSEAGGTAWRFGIAMTAGEAKDTGEVWIVAGGKPGEGEPVFSLAADGRIFAEAAWELIRPQEGSGLIIFYENTRSGRDFANALERLAAESGMRVADRMATMEAPDAYPAVVAKWQALGGDTVAAFVPDEGALVRLREAAAEAGASFRFIEALYLGGRSGVSGGSNTTVLTDYLMNGAWSAPFAEMYRQLYGMQPDRTAAFGFDAILLAAEVARQVEAGLARRPEDVLGGLTNFEGALRSYDFTGAGVQARATGMEDEE